LEYYGELGRTRMPATGTKRTQRKNARKPKFQADLAPVEDRIVRSLKEELQLSSNSDFMSDAVALFRWAVAERKRGHKIVSESTTGEREVLVLPRLERVAPEVVLPHVNITWNAKELESLMALTLTEPAQPTEALVRVMRS
jgi:hypothetical protein